MRKRTVLNGQAGLSLVEIVLAVAIFSVVIGATAQSLMSFYVGIDAQEQRIEALSAARGVLDGLREKRYEFRNDFPDGLIAWVEENNATGWSAVVPLDGYYGRLPDRAIEARCYDTEGNPASDGDNPILVEVTTTWTGGRGRAMSATAVSMLTNE
ncbi:MAG: type II secretion system protein [Candidatus Hydrogenedentes bacterium]|nr:type II secretion system protein [Candidatus Hydrogenedentota bacterium]